MTKITRAWPPSYPLANTAASMPAIEHEVYPFIGRGFHADPNGHIRHRYSPTEFERERIPLTEMARDFGAVLCALAIAAATALLT